MSFNCLRLQAAAVLLAAIASPALAAEYFVNSLLDDGSSGTLRDAITQANASGEASSIYFNVGGTSRQPLSSLCTLQWGINLLRLSRILYL